MARKLFIRRISRLGLLKKKKVTPTVPSTPAPISKSKSGCAFFIAFLLVGIVSVLN